MKECPIIFSAPMVRALLDGRKTQTRRIMKNQPAGQSMGPVHIRHIDGGFQWHGAAGESSIFPCPYGQVDDRLWVRETYLPKASGTIYRADFSEFEAAGLGGMYGGWKPSIYCKREYSRILFKITGLRVERLNDISEADAMAEGATPSGVGDDLAYLQYRAGYQTLWESINGAGSWDANPWVWVIEFRRVEQ